MDTTAIRPVSAETLMDRASPARADVLAPLLASNGSALVYGPGGVGKTFFALGIAWAAASGGSFLGWRAARPHRVLYIDGELGAADMRERLALFGRPPPGLKLVLPDLSDGPLLDLAQPEGIVSLMAGWNDPELVVIDSLASLAGLNGDPERWNNLQNFLIHQRTYGHRAVVLVHHANRDGGLRGSTRCVDALDLVIALRRPKDWRAADGARFEIHFEKARRLRGDAAEPILAQLTSEPGQPAHWRWGRVPLGSFERAVALLKQGVKPEAMGRALGISRSTAFDYQRKARERGLLSMVPLTESNH